MNDTLTALLAMSEMKGKPLRNEVNGADVMDVWVQKKPTVCRLLALLRRVIPCQAE